MLYCENEQAITVKAKVIKMGWLLYKRTICVDNMAVSPEIRNTLSKELLNRKFKITVLTDKSNIPYSKLTHLLRKRVFTVLR